VPVVHGRLLPGLINSEPDLAHVGASELELYAPTRAYRSIDETKSIAAENACRSDWPSPVARKPFRSPDVTVLRYFWPLLGVTTATTPLLGDGRGAPLVPCVPGKLFGESGASAATSHSIVRRVPFFRSAFVI
jgi:hypothetical protein